MTQASHDSHIFGNVSKGSGTEVFDVLGPTVEFLTWNDDYCVMRGVVPPGVAVPLHSHDDAEDFYILSGTQQVPSPPWTSSSRPHDWDGCSTRSAGRSPARRCR